MDTELPLAEELAAVHARMSGLLLSSETVTTALELTTTLAKATLPGTDGAGITLRDEHGDRVTAAATDPLVASADKLQYELDEGPCLTAWDRRILVRVDDLAHDDRWPRWTAAVTGIRSVLSAPLVGGDDGLGALKVYSHRPNGYDDHDEHVLTLFAAHVAVLLAGVRSAGDARRVSDDLRDAMRARDLVHLAKGVLMAREAAAEQTAFLMLTGMAREQARTLRDVAQDVVQSPIRRLR